MGLCEPGALRVHQVGEKALPRESKPSSYCAEGRSVQQATVPCNKKTGFWCSW